MAATITYASSRVQISGPYKAFTGTSTTTVVTYSAGEAPAGGDVGRFVLWCRGGTTDTGPWEVRRIIAATATTVTVHDPWTTTPTNGDTFRISSNADDILAAQPSAGTKTGSSLFAMNCDLDLTAAAFFGSADEAIEWTRTGVSVMFPMASNCVIQCGQAWGGEGSARETTNGSRWSIYKTSGGNAQLYSSSDSRDASGFVINFYGSLIESSSNSGYLFKRMRGPTRFIGCVFDGVAGGRLYHESSEIVDCRLSGNNNVTSAWSLGATFTRAIENVASYRNSASFKTYSTHGGVLRGCTLFDSNTTIVRVEGSVGSVLNFIDSTEFADSKISDNGSGIINQYRSVNFTITDSGGAALSGGIVRVNDTNDTTQGAIQTSDGSGICDEILALRRQWTDASPSVTFSPFRIRIRQFGKLWGSLQAAIADPIRQSYAMLADANVTQSSGTAAAHTGITLTDHGGSPVSWNGKNWGITVTCDLSVNPSLTVDDVKHYLHYHLAQDATIGGKASGLLWHNLFPMSGTGTESGTYGSTTKGVRVVDENGDPFPGVIRMQADDDSFYVPPTTVTVKVTCIDQAGSPIQNVRVYLEAGATGPATQGDVILSGLTDASGIVQDAGYSYSGDQSTQAGRSRKGSGSPLYKPATFAGTITASGLDVTVTMIEDE